MISGWALADRSKCEAYTTIRLSGTSLEAIARAYQVPALPDASFAPGDLDEIAVRVAEVDGMERPGRPGARDRPLDHR
jgi:hypothetical protein